MSPTQVPSSPILQSTVHLYHRSPSTSNQPASPVSSCVHKSSIIDSQSSPHSTLFSPALPASKSSSDHPLQCPTASKESPKLHNLLASRRTSTTSSSNVNHHHRFSLQSVLQHTFSSQQHSPGDPVTVPPNPTSPPAPIPSSSSHQPSHSSHRFSAAMKSLFQRKSSIPSSSDSSFSNTSSHNSFTSPGFKVSSLPLSRPIHALKKSPSSASQAPVVFHRHHPSEKKVDLAEALEYEDEDQNGDNCPVCVEDLRMQLPGEKPLAVPICGHRLHASCFEAVYGSLDHARRTGHVLGLCGICRKDMRLVGSSNGSAKNSQMPPTHAVPKHMQTDNHKIHSITRKMLAASPMHGLDLAEDECEDADVTLPSELDLEREDELVGFWQDVDLSNHQPHLLHPGGLESLRIEHKRNQVRGRRSIVKPTLNVVAENPNLFLNKDSVTSQPLTCMVTLELPSLYPTSSPSTPFQTPYNYLPSIPSSSPISPTSAQSKPFRDVSPSFNGSTYLGTAFSSQDSSTHPLSPNPPATSQFPSNPKTLLLSPLSPSSQRPSENAFDRVRATPDVSSSLAFRRSRESSIIFAPPQPAHLDHLPPLLIDSAPTQPLQPVLDDLLERMEDWKGHSSLDFGILKKYDRIYVEKEENCRQFIVYLFEEALLCVSQVRGSSSSPWLKSDDLTTGSLVGGLPLKLKGRVYVRHMHSVTEIANTPVNLPSLRIKMKDEKLDAFIMRFEDHTRMDDWCTAIRSLIEKSSQKRHLNCEDLQIMSEVDRSTFVKTNGNVSSQIADPDPSRMVLDSTRSSKSDSLCSMSDRQPLSSNDGGSSLFNGSTKTNLVTTVSTLSSVGEECTEPFITQLGCPNHFMHPQPFTPGDFLSSHLNPALRSASLRHDFCPLDLAIIVSIPTFDPVNSIDPSPSTTKLDLLKQSLQFLVYHLHPRSRLSLVAFIVGSKNTIDSRGILLHTPFLIVGKPDSLKRIEFAIEQIARAGQTEGILTSKNWKYFGEDIAPVSYPDGLRSATQHQSHARSIQDKVRRRLRMLDRTEDKVSVITAVNLAYDMILTRKQKNPLGGILLLNDSRDCSTKPEMALVMTRAEAVHIPIQSIGWGEAHNPSSLWQLSNHTGGTYTFVPDHHSIKEAIAGCVGGMLSVGMSNTRVSISIPENKWFKIKKVSGVSHVVSSDGQHAELQVGQLRFGECRDVLVEVEMKSAKEVYSNQENGDPNQVMLGLEHAQKVETSTDAFFRSQVGDGINVGILGDTDPFTRFYECQFESMNDDVPLFEVNVSYHDPQAGRTVTKLPRPVVLMVTIAPSMVDSTVPLALNEPSIVKRRVELLTADSLSRVLLLVSRRMDSQALRLMGETCRIISTLMFNLYQIDPSKDVTEFFGSKAFDMIELLMRSGKMKRTLQHASVFAMLSGCLQIMKRVVEALEEIQNTLQECGHLTAWQQGPAHVENTQFLTNGRAEEMIYLVRSKFERGMKNFVAEQSGILRDQRTWIIHSTHLNSENVIAPLENGSSFARGSNLRETMVSIIEEMYFRSDYSIWMKNMIENWIPERA